SCPALPSGGRWRHRRTRVGRTGRGDGGGGSRSPHRNEEHPQPEHGTGEPYPPAHERDESNPPQDQPTDEEREEPSARWPNDASAQEEGAGHVSDGVEQPERQQDGQPERDAYQRGDGQDGGHGQPDQEG